MVQPNSGADLLELFDVQQGWIPFLDGYLREATKYRLRFHGPRMDIRFQGIPIPFFQEEGKGYATFLTPFQSGSVQLFVNGQEFSTFVYPDDRKLTEEQFSLMLEEILAEANSCFQLSGLTVHVNASGRNRDITWTQWSYLYGHFHKLKHIFSKIEKQPLRRLDKYTMRMKREKVKHSEQVTLRWMDQRGHGDVIPTIVQNVKTLETRNLYENQVVKQQLQDLYRLLRKYELVGQEDVARKALKYKGIFQRWLNSALMNEVTANNGPYTITQKFRKHPVYRLWYQWFDQLYKHNREDVGFDYSISLKDTFQLYEIWCFMKVVKCVREAGLVSDTSGLYKLTKDGIFLNLAENKESKIRLRGGIGLYFQRVYQFNFPIYHTYTQKMIPNIVLEGETGIIVFDPKYRVPDNLGTALGEMHKYRDGILKRETGERAVHEVYILTPTNDAAAEGMRYFHTDFHDQYGMGAIRVMPGEEDEIFRRKIVESVVKMSKETIY
ncbi:restriction endonuclease-like protein [Neobacillus niacini]|uniref:restriction endonuclease-like protein n=1 Tax=Neobacillus niacini TaxID=86668 RepID=UPI0021CB685D|nr:restriction endonuclease-like protein [Neobacillus niacini]MCM3767712.1 restriction endonuclease-like protein [Neobacillus niacini]